MELSSNATGSSPGNGGALHTTGPGTVSITGGMVLRNTASAEGGGLWNSASGTLRVDKSTINHNNADGTAADQGGGGIFNDGGVLTVSNSTVSQNNAVAAGGGVNNSGTAQVINVTLYQNSATNGAGGVSNTGEELSIVNSIIAHGAATGADCSGVTAGDFNLDSDGSCQAALTGDPLLGPLQNNGGGTFTHALRPNSPALDAGSAAVCAAPPINNLDQRGLVRPAGAECDLGAYEGGGIVGDMMQIFFPFIAENVRMR